MYKSGCKINNGTVNCELNLKFYKDYSYIFVDY